MVDVFLRFEKRNKRKKRRPTTGTILKVTQAI